MILIGNQMVQSRVLSKSISLVTISLQIFARVVPFRMEMKGLSHFGRKFGAFYAHVTSGNLGTIKVARLDFFGGDASQI